jgi:hypothetical protein
MKKSKGKPQNRELVFQVGSFFNPRRARFSLARDVEEQEIPGIMSGVSISSGSESSLNLAKHWYYDCLLDHDSCELFTTAFKGNKWLPKRLIHITETEARICYGKEPPETDLPYATVSHCWGKTPIFTMKSTNITAHERQLLMS